jgi:hypothetical protein
LRYSVTVIFWKSLPSGVLVDVYRELGENTLGRDISSYQPGITASGAEKR